MTDLPELSDEQWEIERRQLRADYERAHLADGSLLVGRDDGIQERLIFDETENRFVVEKVQDVESVLEWCRGRFNEGLANRHCEFRHVGRYPVIVLQIFAQKWGFSDWASCLKDKTMMHRLLNDRDLGYFRTLPGRVGRRA